MKRSTNALTELIKQLTVIRTQHVAALAEIESAFHEFGMGRLLHSARTAGPSGGAKRRAGAAEAVSTGKGAGRRGRPAGTATKRKGAKAGKAAKATKAATRGTKKPTKRVRGKFEITGDELIIRFVRKLGCPTTEEIRRHWESEGRRGKAENNLTNLVKSGKLLRNRIAGQTRSTYSLPASS